jgi:hypothetical protein
MVGKIPGYNGYKEKEMRREADSLLREHLANQLKEQLTRAEDVASQMLTGPGLSQLSEMGKGNTRLQTLIDKVKTAAQGYAGFFDAVRVKEDELDALYQFDQNMLMQVGEIGKSIDGVQAALDAGETVPKAVRDYIQAITDMSEKFDTRRNRMVEIA